MIAPETTGSISNTVTVNPQNTILESDYTNNSFALTTTVQTGIDLCVPGGSAICNAGSVKVYCPFAAPGPLDCSTTPKGVATSSMLTYIIKIPNQGTQDTTGVVVQDTLPTGTTYISATGDHNFTCAQSGGIVTCSGGIINGTYTTAATTPPTTPFPPPTSSQDVATITISVFSTAAPGAMPNQVRVDPQNTIPEFDKTNNLNTLSILAASGGANPYIDLSITKAQISPTKTPNAVAPNGTLTYELTISNDITANPLSSLGTAEEATATNVGVRDFLPQGARFISVNAVSGGFICSEAPAPGQTNTEEVDCTGGTVMPGAPNAVKIDVTMFAPGTPGNYTTQALVDPNNTIAEGDETNNTYSITTAVGIGNGGDYIDLTTTMTADHGTGGGSYNQPSVTPGGQITYIVSVSNLGSGDAFNVEVKDTLPGGSTRFVSASDSSPNTPGAFSCSQSVAGTIDCIGGTILGTVSNGGSAGSRQIQIVVDAPNQAGDFPQTAIPNDTTITNQAIVNPSGAIPESNPTNNSSSWQTLIHSVIDLTVTQTGPDSATQSSNQTYVLTVTNSPDKSGTAATAYGVQVHDPLPVGIIVTGVDYTPTNAWQCQVQQNPVNVVDCSGDLPGGQNVVINIHVFIAATDGTKLDNLACVDPNNLIVEYNERNNCSNATTSVGHLDMTIIKVASAPSVTPGGTVIYSLVAINNGTSTATTGQVTVTDDLSSTGMTITGTPTATNGFTCTVTNSNTLLTCTNSSAALSAGSSATMGFTASVPLSASGVITNTATVSDTDSNDTNTSDKTSSVTVTVGTPVANHPDISINASASVGTVTPGGTETYTLTVSNNGAASAATGNVTVTDDLSATGMTIAGTPTTTNGFDCTASSSTILSCTNTGAALAAGSSATITFTASVPTSAVGQITTIVTVTDSDPTDTNTADKSASVTINVAATAINLQVKSVTGASAAGPGQVTPPGTLTFTIVATNSGTGNPSGSVTVRNVFTTGVAGLTLVGAFGSNGFTCDQTVSSNIGMSGNPGLDCSGALPPSATTTLTLKFVVGPGAINPIVLTSTIDPDHLYQPINTPGNNQTASISVNGALTCSTCQDVEASLLGSPDPVVSGGTMTYSAAVVNVGDKDIKGTVGHPSLVFFISLDSSIAIGSATWNVSGPNPVGNAWSCVTAHDFFIAQGFAGVPAGFAPGANTLVCQGDLLVGQGVTVSVSGKTTASSGSTITTTIDGDGTENAFTPQQVLPEPSANDAPDQEGVTTQVS
jgi:uncharacterized repeat protein (TIGR01451 family)